MTTMRIDGINKTKFVRRYQAGQRTRAGMAERAANMLVMAASLGLVSMASAADGIDLSKITDLVCNFAKQLSAVDLLGAAGLVIVLVFGWNKLMGEGNAFQGLKSGAIGAIVILSAGTIATAIFGGKGC